MNLHKCYLTKNDCYKSGKTHTVKGIMVHSTGCNNVNLKRYVQPDDGVLGKNLFGNHWNKSGLDKCVHAFIGKTKTGEIATYQTLPWTMVGWHSGSGIFGKFKNANNTGYIGFEICEDNLKSKDYFEAVYKEAVDLCVYLCKLYGLTENKIICHCEGAKQGIASNHGDVMHWFPKYGKSMDTFRADVKAGLEPKAETDAEFKAGDLVSIKDGATYYTGKAIPSWVKKEKWFISSIKGDRAVLGKNECKTNDICSPINTKFLSK